MFGLVSLVGFFLVGGWMWQKDRPVLALICFALGVLRLGFLLF
jgi:hypothetical protein